MIIKAEQLVNCKYARSLFDERLLVPAYGRTQRRYDQMLRPCHALIPRCRSLHVTNSDQTSHATTMNFQLNSAPYYHSSYLMKNPLLTLVILVLIITSF